MEPPKDRGRSQDCGRRVLDSARRGRGREMEPHGAAGIDVKRHGDHPKMDGLCHGKSE